MMKIMSGGNSTLGLKDHPDTSIAQRAMTACGPTSLGLKDRRIVCMVETSTPSSIGLSDLMIDLFRFIALRAMLVSKRSVGAVDFLTNLIALRAMLVSKRSVGAILMTFSYLKIVSPAVSQSKRSTDI